jgi:DNA-binding transcriptional LysR family regulator
MTHIAASGIATISAAPRTYSRGGTRAFSKSYAPRARAADAASPLSTLALEPRGSDRQPLLVRKITLDSLAALDVFVRAAETCSFTDAGRQLGLSSSAVGKCVSRLEQRLGVRLFHRNTRCIKLTQEGNSLVESCRRIFLELRGVEEEFAQSNGTPKGRLRVSMPLIGMRIIPNLSKFIRLFPEIELDIDFTDSIVDVVDGGYDVVLRTGEANDSRLMSRVLGKYAFEIVGSPDYFARAGVPLRSEELSGHACLNRKHPITGKIERWPITPSAATNSLALASAATASTIDALICLAEQGAGIACVPDFCVRRQIHNGYLISVLKEHVEHTEHVIRAMWPSSRYLSPRLRVFIDFLAENLLQKISSIRKANEVAAA